MTTFVISPAPEDILGQQDRFLIHMCDVKKNPLSNLVSSQVVIDIMDKTTGLSQVWWLRPTHWRMRHKDGELY